MARYKNLGLVLCAGLLFLVGAAASWADPVVIDPHDIACVGSSCTFESDPHEDKDPFKGSITLTVTNTGSAAWTDFHFEFFEVLGYAVDDVAWVVTSPYEPTIAINGNPASFDNVVVDNVTVGATLDLYFSSNPVGNGDTVQFVVYSDNTASNVPFFATIYYPTPEPGTLLLFGLGALGLGFLGRRARKR